MRQRRWLGLLVVVFLAQCNALGFCGNKVMPKSIPSGYEVHVIGIHEGALNEQVLEKCKQKSAKGSASGKISGSSAESVDMDCRMGGRTAAFDDSPQQFINLKVTRQGVPVILVLMGFHRIQWRLDVAPSVRLKKVILSGHFPQTVKGLPKNTPLEVYSGKESPCDDCYKSEEYFTTSSIGGDDFVPALRSIKRLTGKVPDTLQMKFRGEAFVISDTTRRFSLEEVAEQRRLDRQADQ